MKKVFLITLFLSLGFLAVVKMEAQTTAKLVEMCTKSAGDDATYLKDFVVELEAAGSNEKPPVAKFSMVLSKNNVYRFTVCNAGDSEGKAVIQLFDMNRLLGSSYNAATGQEYQSFNFQCQKTGVYHVFINFVDGKKGSAVGILSFIKTL